MLRLLKAIMATVLEGLWKYKTAVRRADVRDEIWSRDLQNTNKAQKIQISDGVDDLLHRQQLDNGVLRWSFTALIPTGGSVCFHRNWVRNWRCMTQINCPVWRCLPVMAVHYVSDNITTDFLKRHQNNVIWRWKYSQAAKCKHTVSSSG